MIEEKKPFSRIKRNATETQRIRKLRKIIPPVIGVIIALLLILYVVSLLFSRYGSFTIRAKDYSNREYALSLCENDKFRRHSSRLVATEVKEMDNISGLTLPTNLNDTNGAHNGKNYLAYTFYVMNSGEKTCSYKYSLVITRATVGIDAAARIRVYHNADYFKTETGEYTYSGDYTDYAKPQTGGNGEPEVDPDNRVMTNFVSNDIIAEGTADNFAPGDMAKMTVVIWLEGDDPDCTDDVLGGQLKVDMVIEITSGAE